MCRFIRNFILATAGLTAASAISSALYYRCHLYRLR